LWTAFPCAIPSDMKTMPSDLKKISFTTWIVCFVSPFS
jgi:hypothetical protein